MNVKNYYSFCNDSAIKVRLDGKTIHSFFKPMEFLEFGTGTMREPVIRHQIVDMPIEHFLGLAEPIPPDDGLRHRNIEKSIEDVLQGQFTDWCLPYLILKENEDGVWKVIGHDGRHRAMILMALGYEELPVLIKIPESKLLSGLDSSVELWCQNDCGIKRERYTFPFPITKENYNKAYIEIEGLRKRNTAQDESDGANMFCVAPSYCVKARNNFEKNKTKKLVMPFSTYYEFVMKQKA